MEWMFITLSIWSSKTGGKHIRSRNQDQYHLYCQSTSIELCTNDDFQSCYLSNTPNNSILTKCFLSKFSTQGYLYLNDMTHITVGSTISFDHTCKVAANIGKIKCGLVSITVSSLSWMVMVKYWHGNWQIRHP